MSVASTQWEKIITDLSKDNIDINEAFKASGFATKKEFTIKLIMTASQNKGTLLGKNANNIVIQMQKASRAHKNTLRARRVKHGTAVMLTVVSLFTAVGAYESYQYFTKKFRQSVLKEQGILSANKRTQTFKLNKKITKKDDLGSLLIALYFYDVEFWIQDTGEIKVGCDYFKTEKGTTITVKTSGDLGPAFNAMRNMSKKPVEKKKSPTSKIIKNFTAQGDTPLDAGSYNPKTKKLHLKIIGEVTERWPDGRANKTDVAIQAVGKFDGNNFNFTSFFAQIDGKAVRLKGWKAIKAKEPKK